MVPAPPRACLLWGLAPGRGMEARWTPTDPGKVNKKVLWMCIAVGSTVGGYLPTFFGQSSFGLISIFGSLVGGVAGVFAAQRIDVDL